MNFESEFPQLTQFFGAYFPDADFENLTDKEVVSNYIADCNKSEASKKILKIVKEKELPALINNVEVHWEYVRDEANRYFENSQDALKWLNMIKKELEK
ncbi:hypothetical protein OK18_14310 [Chryseobacterium gallinarum]|uniref:CdiI immunity protein domain-containing protein n=1 Tax=Chryseobacterium gallinarum TaxID=1324352 RepID=A0A0G3M4R8_CHRGL|nr:hypothetical protein [Chryseobacterium gallinarum]AKK73615.1 hypothetical protein OK18_14310 [Chryseobacterium gallinarum]